MDFSDLNRGPLTPLSERPPGYGAATFIKLNPVEFRILIKSLDYYLKITAMRAIGDNRLDEAQEIQRIWTGLHQWLIYEMFFIPPWMETLN